MLAWLNAATAATSPGVCTASNSASDASMGGSRSQQSVCLGGGGWEERKWAAGACKHQNDLQRDYGDMPFEHDARSGHISSYSAHIIAVASLEGLEE